MKGIWVKLKEEGEEKLKKNSVKGSRELDY